MTKDLSKPIDVTDTAFSTLLDELQGNILKGHGRHETINRFLSFDPSRAASVRIALAGLATRLTSTSKQLTDTAAFKAGGSADEPVAFLMLSHAGYRKLGVPVADIPDDPAFAAGMRSRQAKLLDPDPSVWDELFRRDIDALLLVGASKASAAKAFADMLCSGFSAAGIAVLGDEIGHAIFNKANDGIEHFGYVDGRSQPLLLEQDVIDEQTAHGGIDKWNPAFSPIDTVLVPEGASEETDQFGSYFVFRKLGQDVNGFKKAEKGLASVLGLANPELAGAMVVGRFEDGTPLIDSRTPKGGPVPNNFNYDTDIEGETCPFQSHIRKTNPRGDVQREFKLPDARGDRGPIMARRGIPFGGAQLDPEASAPKGGVGLLFMAYQRSIVDQFEFTQSSWANNEDFLRRRTGIDPVIGHGGSVTHHWPNPIGTKTLSAFRFADFVSMRGGEYFFAPSLGFLRNLAPSQTVKAT